jgi:hypothetical protein
MPYITRQKTREKGEKRTEYDTPAKNKFFLTRTLRGSSMTFSYNLSYSCEVSVYRLYFLAQLPLQPVFCLTVSLRLSLACNHVVTHIALGLHCNPVATFPLQPQIAILYTLS